MRRSFLFLSAVLAYAGVVVLQVAAQGSGQLAATVQFNNGESLTVTDFSSSTALLSNEVVNVSIQFPASQAGSVVDIDVPNGGSASVGNNPLVIGDDGRINLAFRASATAGPNSISVHGGFGSFSLQFSVTEAAR